MLERLRIIWSGYVYPKGNLNEETEARLKVAQSNEMWTNYIKATIDKM